MKTKIVYISGNEIFDMRDIRAAFEEVRNALNLDTDTVLFGVPVDNEDAGIMPVTDATPTQDVSQNKTSEIIEQEPTTESQVETPQPKTSHSRKKQKNEKESEPVVEIVSETTEIVDIPPDITDEETLADEEKVVPILSVLGAQDKEEDNDDVVEEQVVDTEETSVSEDADLEKLLSEMTPLQEDIIEEENIQEEVPEPDIEDDISVDATLEQLASEFAENQDKIVSETKSSQRSKIGKLRNILPFKQSKHKDNGLGDLFGWAGVAANDEEFSVPGFFTNSVSKK